MSKRLLLVLGVVASCLGVAAFAYLAVRVWTGDDSSVTAEVNPPAAPTSRMIEVGQAEARKPILDSQVINGILVGASVEDGEIEACLTPEAVPRELELADVAGSPLDFEPGYLPEGVTLLQGRASSCGDTVVFVEKQYHVPTVEGGGPGLVQQSGGVISVRRIMRPNDRIHIVGPADRFEPITVQGKPGVMLRPPEPPGVAAGAFEGTIVIKEPSGGFTVVQGGGLAWDEVVKLAQYLEAGR